MDRTLGRIASLSICLIVRDEQAMLPGLLRSLEGLPAQLCALDTGSTDGTVALLRSAGATVAHRAWDDDFAAARNASLQLATGDWVLVLDADERLGERARGAIRSLLSNDAAGAASIVLRSRFEGGDHRDSRLLRLFRREPEVRYHHAIHEDCSESVSAMLARTGRRAVALPDDAVVEHLGYTRDRAAERDKKARDERILRGCLAADPSDRYARFKLLELARFWADAALASEIASPTAALLDAGSLPLHGWPHGGELLVLVARGLHPGDPREASAWLEQRAADADPSAALWLALGELREVNGDDAGARSAFERCLQGRDGTVQRVTVRPLMGLARLDLLASDVPAAAERVAQALVFAPDDPEAQLGRQAVVQSARSYAETLLGTGNPAEAAATLLPALSFAPELGIGVLVCDLLLGRDTDLELDITQEQADAALRHWVEVLRPTPLFQILRAVAPAIAPMFPWLEEAL